MNEHPDNSHQLDEDLATAAALISAAGQVALACHVAPDGDALGSMLALHHVLRAGGRDSVAAFAGVQVTGPHYRELPGLDLLSDPLRYPAEPEVMVTLDCGSLGRLGDLALNAKAAKELVVVDHHVPSISGLDLHPIGTRRDDPNPLSSPKRQIVVGHGSSSRRSTASPGNVLRRRSTRTTTMPTTSGTILPICHWQYISLISR